MKNPEIYQHEDKYMQHEDYFTSYAFRQATNGMNPIITTTGLSEPVHKNFGFSFFKHFTQEYLEIRSHETVSRFYSLRSVKVPEEMYKLHDTFYEADGGLKELVYDEYGLVQ